MHKKSDAERCGEATTVWPNSAEGYNLGSSKRCNKDVLSTYPKDVRMRHLGKTSSGHPANTSWEDELKTSC